MRSVIFFFALWAFSEAEEYKECPYPADILPYCTCKEFGGSFCMMECKNIVNEDDLLTGVNATKGYDIMSINIANTTLNYIPEHTFEGTTFTKIRFSNSQIMSLSDTDVAFKGLENHLEELRATGVEYTGNWDWSQLKNLKRLEVIDVHNITMHIDDEFPALPSLKILKISKAYLSHIHSQAFKNLKNLKLLILKDNEIEVMSRSMLPTPAFQLQHIDLSQNNLASLPHDFFTEMPELNEVLLVDNKFVTIEEETFSGIFNTVSFVQLHGNKINCDCHLRWLVTHKIPLYFDERCYEPPRLHNVRLDSLTHDVLLCK